MANKYGFIDDAANYVGSVPNKVISLFRSDNDPGDYSSRKAALARQQKLAEMLSQMGAQEQAVSTAGGITAPVSPMGALARGLTSFGGAYLSGKAAADEAALKKEQGEARAKALEKFFQNPDTTMTMPGGSYQTDQKGEALPKYLLDDAEAMAAGPATKTVSLPDITSNVAGGPTSYADKVRMAYQFAAGDDERLAALAPTLLTAAQPKIESIGARGSIVQDPLTGEMQVVGVPNEVEAPKVAGGLQWTGKNWEPIPGYTEQQAAIAAARRPDVIGGQPRMQQGSVFSLPDGRKVSAVFDPNRGQYGIVDNSGKFNPLPEGARPTTAGVGNPLSRSQYFKLKNDYRTEGTALTKMNRYFKTVGDANTGFAKLADQIAAKTRTAFGSKTLTPEQLNAQVGEGQLQGLLGLFRTDIVGPGVMTEYDAERVLRALGGDFKLLQNPAVVKSLLQDIYADKMTRVKDYEAEINFNSQYFPGDVKPKIDVPETLGGGQSATPASGEWTTLPNGIRVRERK